MLDNYNSKIPEKVYEVEREDAPGPGDADFVAENMLEDEYYIHTTSQNNYTFQLMGPSRSSSWKWIVSEYNENLNLYESVTLKDTKLDTQYFSCVIPNYGLESGHSYWVTLEVTSKNGTPYRDTTVLHVLPILGPGPGT